MDPAPLLWFASDMFEWQCKQGDMLHDIGGHNIEHGQHKCSYKIYDVTQNDTPKHRYITYYIVIS